MKFKVKKTDGRHAGGGNWKYFVEINCNNTQQKRLFCEWREWCWSQWGPSKELNFYSSTDLFDGVACSNANWCWLADQWRSRLYFRTESEASMFTLKWYD